MKLQYFRHADAPNFGDELNPWLWPRLLGDALDENESSLFIGIGSILSNDYPANATKVVMGTGYGGYAPPPIVDSTWRFGFVRGPQTAELLGLPASVAITDGAVLVRTVFTSTYPELYRVSFMPHWETLARGRWRQVCDWAGVHLIDPREPVESVLTQIKQSRVIVTEAMHGAIVADALRVPWIAVLPLASKHRFKWTDWTRSLQLPYAPRSLAPSGWSDLKTLCDSGGTASSSIVARGAQAGSDNGLVRRTAESRAGRLAEVAFTATAAARLSHLGRCEPVLSRDSVIADATERALERVAAFRRETGKAAA